MQLTDPKIESPSRERRWFQYSLRTLLVVMLLASVGMSWFAVTLQQARRQKEAVEAIVKLEGWVTFDYEYDSSYKFIPNAQPPGPAWARRLLGESLFASPVSVACRNDAALAYARELPSFRCSILHSEGITDAGLRHLEGLAEVRELLLLETRVTDAGLEHVRHLTQLESLLVQDGKGEGITDAGLEHIRDLNQLWHVTLFCNVSDKSLACLEGLTQLESLSLGGSEVKDGGLRYLKGLPKLRSLDLTDTGVTDAGLEHLAGIRRLALLRLYNTQVTDEGVKKLQQALPNCNIEK